VGGELVCGPAAAAVDEADGETAHRNQPHLLERLDLLLVEVGFFNVVGLAVPGVVGHGCVVVGLQRVLIDSPFAFIFLFYKLDFDLTFGVIRIHRN